MYPSTTLFIAFGQFAIMVNVMCSYPLQVHPCRNCLDKVISSSKKAATDQLNGVNTEEDEDTDGMDADHAASDMSTLKHVLLTAGIVTCGYAVAFFVSDLQMGESDTQVG